jgi:hypothetical protein
MLLVAMLKGPVTSRTQKAYANRVSFYKSIWKLRDAEVIRSRELQVDDEKIKEWSLNLDGTLLARMLAKMR